MVIKDDDIILRIKDDCVPFDQKECSVLLEGEDPVANIGIRMVYAVASDVTYRNTLGLNVLTKRI